MGTEPEGKGVKAMRRLKLLVPLVALLMVAAACDGDDGEEGGEGQAEDTGSVNLLSAVEPEEGTAVQAIFDDLINSEVDYTAEIESSGDFEAQFQIRAEGGTLDVAALPQPGAVAAQAAAGTIVSLEDMGFDIGALEEQFGEYFMSLGLYEGEHYGRTST
jgi:hypothetical protein